MRRRTVFSDSAIRLFLESAEELCISLPEERIPLFEKYYQELLFWNEKVNLTRITDERKVIVDHFLDSLVPERFITPGATVADIGTGAGFPGIPLKIVRPDLLVTLVESSFKKVAFLRHVVRLLGLKGIGVRHGRVEKGADWGPEFAFCIGRALSALPSFLAMARLVIVSGGTIVAMRGARYKTELQEITKDLSAKDLSVETVFSIVLPVTHAQRGIIVFRASP